MKVFMGSFNRWWHPNKILLPLKYVFNISDADYYGNLMSKEDSVIGRFEKTRLGRFLKRKSFGTQQRIYVKIDKWDTWSADNTLAKIILPMLKQLKETKNGSPFVELADVPEDLHPSEEANAENGYIDNTHHQRWDYVISEMIWAFEQKNREWWQGDYVIEHAEIDFDDKEEVEVDGEIYHELKWKNEGKYDKDGESSHQERMSNGFRLFGKYYEALWD